MVCENNLQADRFIIGSTTLSHKNAMVRVAMFMTALQVADWNGKFSFYGRFKFRKSPWMWMMKPTFLLMKPQFCVTANPPKNRQVKISQLYIYIEKKKRKVNISQSSQSNKKGRLEPVRSLGKSWGKPGPSVSCLMRHGIDDLLFQALVPGTASGAVSWFFDRKLTWNVSIKQQLNFTKFQCVFLNH